MKKFQGVHSFEGIKVIDSEEKFIYFFFLILIYWPKGGPTSIMNGITLSSSIPHFSLESFFSVLKNTIVALCSLAVTNTSLTCELLSNYSNILTYRHCLYCKN
jgi:hypothetical protein